jgi:threonine dehydrogenase-like Zn-dependent dehydrogenase
MPNVLAAVIPRAGAAAEVRELPVPDLEVDSALMLVELSEVCGTDVHLRAGRLAGVPYPLIPGHVTVGRLDKIRGTIKDVTGRALREGERVTFLDVHRTCNACWYCLVAKASTRCPHRKVYGISYGVADGLAGGWAEAMYLKPGTRILPLGDVAPNAFMAGGCGLPTSIHAVERADISIGDTVLVLGSGPVGLSAIALARMSGAARVLCIGSPALRLESACDMGAHEVLDIAHSSPEERVAWVRTQTDGRGADITIECAGVPDAVVQAMRCTRDAGRVVIVGQYTDHGDVAFNPHLDLNKKHLEVRGCWGSDFSHFYRAVQVALHEELGAPWSRLELDGYGLARANEALDAVERGEVIKALINPAISD